MLLDDSLLRRATPKNLMRLAIALGLPVPPRAPRAGTKQFKQLVTAIASKIRRDAMMDELNRLAAMRS